MSNTLWVLKDPILLASSFTLEDVLKGNITMECVMAQLRAMSTHFVKDWIMSVLMIYIHSLLREQNLKNLLWNQ